MKNKVILLAILFLNSLVAHGSEYKTLLGVNAGFGYLNAEKDQLNKYGLNLGIKAIGSFEFKSYFLDVAAGYQMEFLKANYISIQNNSPIGELSMRKKMDHFSLGPLLQVQSGVYSTKPTTNEESKMIINLGLQAIYKTTEYEPRFEVSLVNSIASNHMTDRNLTTIRFGIQIPFGSEPEKTKPVARVRYKEKKEECLISEYLPVMVVPGFVAKSVYIDQTTNLGFKIKSYQLDSYSYFKLDRLADFIHKNKIKIGKIVITGYADNLGTNEYNMILSEKRANVVKNIFLKNKVGSKVVIISSGKGFHKPMKELSDKYSVKNRRTEIKFIHVEISNELNKELKVILNNDPQLITTEDKNNEI